MCALNGAHERNGPLVDQGLEVDIVNGRQGQVQQVSGEGRYGGKVAVEEDGVQDGCGSIWSAWVFAFTHGLGSGDGSKDGSGRRGGGKGLQTHL